MISFILGYNHHNCYNKNNNKMDKENCTYSHSPLRQKPVSNKINLHKDQNKINRNDPILIAIEEEINSKTSTHMFDLMLTDPLLLELNKSLEKQAEQQKKNKLLETFPLRFKNLIHTQQLYKKLKNNLTQMQRQTQEAIETQSMQKQSLKSEVDDLKMTVSQLKIELQSKDNAMQDLQKAFQFQKREIQNQYDQKVQEKIRKITQLQRKLMKTKNERQYFMEQLEEMKQESLILRQENQRIIKTITQKQEEISQLNRIITQKQSSYKLSKQRFMEELTTTKIKFQQSLTKMMKELNEATNTIDGYKVRMNEYEDKLISLCNEQQEEDNERFNEIQEVRLKLLEEIKEKNNLQQKYEYLQEQSISEIEQLNNQIEILHQEITNLNIKIGQNNLHHELQLHNVKQTMKKVENNKDQNIDQIKSNLHLLTEQKLFLQAKILKIQGQKQDLASNLQKFKIELEVYSKKIVENCSKEHKNDEKNKQIQKMINKFRDQLKNYNELLNEKQQKIQQYRRQIFSLKKIIKENQMDKQKIRKQLLQKDNLIKQQKENKQIMASCLLKCKQKQNFFKIQSQYYQKIVKKQKNSQETQFQIMQGINDQQEIRIKNLTKELQKSKQKYDNIYEQLEQYKQELAPRLIEEAIEDITQTKINPYQNMIKTLQEENYSMKQLISTKLYEPQDIQNLLDAKIIDLKTFYESKIQEEGKKYRNVIQMLKGEVLQMSKQMSMKKSIQQQMYNEIVQINELRKLKLQD